LETSFGRKSLANAATILIAVSDGVLADSLRFSLELEGLEVKLCDEYSLPRAIPESTEGSCLILDQDVFTRLEENPIKLAGYGLPIILLVAHGMDRLIARAKAAGVTMVVETPLMGAVLSDAIASTLEEGRARAPHR
jgi:FixJ family two-component response regulator